MNVQASTLLEYGMTRSQVVALGLLPGEEPPRAPAEPVRSAPKPRERTAQYERMLQAGKKPVSAYVSDETSAAIDRLAKERGLSRAAFIAMVLDRCAEIGKRQPPPEHRVIEDPEEVIKRVARAHGISVEQIKGPRRQKHIVAARHECIVALRAQGLPLVKIGWLVNRQHHAVMHALGKAAKK